VAPKADPMQNKQDPMFCRPLQNSKHFAMLHLSYFQLVLWYELIANWLLGKSGTSCLSPSQSQLLYQTKTTWFQVKVFQPCVPLSSNLVLENGPGAGEFGVTV